MTPSIQNIAPQDKVKINSGTLIYLIIIQQIFIEQLLGTKTVIEKVANKITNALTLMMLTL